MGEDLSPSCRSLSASCILPFFAAPPRPPYSIIDSSHFHTALSPSFVFFIVFSLKSRSLSLPPPASPTTPPHSPNHPSPPPSSQPHVNWFSLCVMQMFGMVSVAFLDGIHFAFNKTDSDAVCSHGLCPPDYEAARCAVVESWMSCNGEHETNKGWGRLGWKLKSPRDLEKVKLTIKRLI